MMAALMNQENDNMIRKGFPSGFTLMEILVAITVLAVSLTVIFELFSGGLRSGRVSEDYSLAVFYGREKMEEMLFSTPSPGKYGGDMPLGYRWRAVITPVDRSTENERKTFSFGKTGGGLVHILVVIDWEENAKSRRFELETLSPAG